MLSTSCLVHFWLCDQLSADQICGKINLVHISAWQVVVHTECLAKIVLIFYNPLDLSFIYVLNLTVTNIIISVFVRRMTFHAKTQMLAFWLKKKEIKDYALLLQDIRQILKCLMWYWARMTLFELKRLHTLTSYFKNSVCLPIGFQVDKI